MLTKEEIIELGLESEEILNTSIYESFKNISKVPFSLSFTSDYAEKFIKTYIPEMEMEKIGSKGLLVYSKGLDFEVFFASGNARYCRFGIAFRFNLSEANPLDWALKVMKESIEKRGGEKLYFFVKEHEGDGEWDEGYTDIIVSTIPTSEGEIPEIQIDKGFIIQPNDYGRYTIPDVAKEGMAHYGITNSDIVWTQSPNDNYYHSPVSRKLLEYLSKVWNSLNPDGDRVLKCKVCSCDMITRKEPVICPRCSDDYILCDNCGISVKESDAVFNKFSLCKDCSKLSSCHMCGRRLPKGVEDICGNCEDILSSNKRLAYHSRNNNGTDYGRPDLSNGSRFKVGLEIEKEDATVLGQVNLLELGKKGWINERDGSLSESSGFELVSPIYPLDPTFILAHMESLRKYIDARATVKCGGHIHVSDTKRTPFEILRDIQGYLPLLYMLYPDRATNDYCKATEVRYYLDNMGGHHQAINPNEKTLEFRIFPAVKNMESLRFRLNLVKHMIENPRELSVEVGKELLNSESKLFGVLSSVLKPSNIKKKAEAFVDLANYIDKEGLVFNGKDIDMPRLNQYKEKEREEVRNKIEMLKNRYPVPVPRGLRRDKYFTKSRYGKFGREYTRDDSQEEYTVRNISRLAENMSRWSSAPMFFQDEAVGE